MAEQKKDLSKLPTTVKNSQLFKRLNKEQREFCFLQMGKATPVKENSVNKDFHIPGVRELYNRGWEKWLELDAPYCEDTVKEFLATMVVAHDRVNEELIEVGVEGVVNRVRVRITKNGFNDYFECGEQRPENIQGIDGCEELVDHTENYEEIVVTPYIKPGFQWNHPLAYSHLSTKGKVLNAILINRVYSLKNSRYVYPDRIALAYCIERRDIMINLGHHVVGTLISAAKNKSSLSSLILPRTITLFCDLANVKMTTQMPNWVFTEHQLERYRGYEHPDYESEGGGDRPKKKNKRRVGAEEGTSGVEGFEAAEDEPCDLTSFMQQMYIGRREQRDFMARQDHYMETQTQYMASQTQFMARQDHYMEVQTQYMESQRQFEADWRARWATEGPRNMDEDFGGGV